MGGEHCTDSGDGNRSAMCGTNWAEPHCVTQTPLGEAERVLVVKRAHGLQRGAFRFELSASTPQASIWRSVDIRPHSLSHSLPRGINAASSDI